MKKLLTIGLAIISLSAFAEEPMSEDVFTIITAGTTLSSSAVTLGFVQTGMAAEAEISILKRLQGLLDDPKGYRAFKAEILAAEGKDHLRYLRFYRQNPAHIQIRLTELRTFTNSAPIL